MAISQIKAGAILNYVIIGLNTLVGLLYTPFMLRCLGQNDYGLYSLVASVIAYLTILDFGFGNAIIRYTAKFRSEGKQQEQWKMFGMFLIVYSIIGLLAFCGGLGLYFNVDSLFDRTMDAKDLATAQTMMLLLTINLAFTFPLSIFGSIISAYENFVFQRIVNIIRILLSTAVMVALLAVGFKAIALVVVQTAFNLLTLVINYIYAKYRLRISIVFGKINTLFIKEITLYSFWIFLGAIIERIYWGTGQFILGTYVGTAAVAIYSVGILFQQMYMSFSYAISSVLLPKMTAMVAQGKSNSQISDVFIRTGRLQSFVLQFILSGFIVFGMPFIYYWAGADYNDSYYVALIFMLALYVPSIQSTAILILQARNNMRFRTILYLVISIISVVLQIIFSNCFGTIGCAIAVAVALVLGQGLIINIYYNTCQHLDVIAFWKNIITMSIPTVTITIISAYASSNIKYDSMISVLLGIVVYSVIYLSISTRFSLKKSERELLLLPIFKLRKKILGC